MKQTKGEEIFAVCNYFILGLFAVCTVYPFIYVLSASFSSGEAVVEGSVWLFPVQFNCDSYKEVVKQSGIWLAYSNTIFYTVVGTAFSLLITICGAYPLSKKRLPGRSFLSFMIAFTMLFSAGMVPVYLNLRSLGLLNTRTGLIVAFSISTFLVIILRTFFQSIPEEMEEAATIDGASNWQILWKIFLPLSKPALATIGLFYAVGKWNGYFWAMVMLRDDGKMPLQVLLIKLIVSMRPNENVVADAGAVVDYSLETVIYATIIISVLPIIIVYPYIQKFFVKGIMIGSLKG